MGSRSQTHEDVTRQPGMGAGGVKQNEILRKKQFRNQEIGQPNRNEGR